MVYREKVEIPKQSIKEEVKNLREINMLFIM